MKNMIRIIGILVILVLSFLLYNKNLEMKDLKNNYENRLGLKIPDTVRIRDTIKIPKPYPIYQNPDKVEIYTKDPEIRYNDFYLYGDKIVLSNTTDSINISKIFLGSYPLNDKLISLELSRNKLNLSVVNISGEHKKILYRVQNDQFDYVYTQNGLTYKRKFRINPFIEYQFRPRNNFHDLGMGLKFNTNNLYYKIGIQGFYYPSLMNKPNWDMTFGLYYQL